MSPRRFARLAAGALALGIGIALVLGPAPVRADDEDSGQQSDKRVRKIVIEEPKNKEDAEAGYLGVLVQDLTRSLRRAMNVPGTDGALVNRVEEESPADKAGIQKGDVILEVNREAVSDAGDLTHAVRGLKPGSRVPIVVYRDGSRKTLTVTVGSRPDDSGSDEPQVSWWRGDGADRGDMPMPPSIQREPMLRQQRDLERQLDDIQQQLTRLREEDLSRLADELRALRSELRDRGLLRDDSREPRDRGKSDREDD